MQVIKGYNTCAKTGSNPEASNTVGPERRLRTNVQLLTLAVEVLDLHLKVSRAQQATVALVAVHISASICITTQLPSDNTCSSCWPD